jgi:SAM-dependent methyltransferase
VTGDASLCHRRVGCRLCGSQRLSLVLKLEPTPPANAFVPADELGKTQPRFPLDIFFCEDCKHVQLLDVVDPRHLFENYVYVSGTSPVFVKHFEDYAANLIARYKPGSDALAFDIGSNDGTLLKAFKGQGLKVLGIDPAIEIAKRATESGIPTIAGFFSPAKAAEIRAQHGPASIITANNVFAHIDDLGAVADGIAALLADDGVFAFEVSYLKDVVNKTLFDTIYHEHLDYHSVIPLIAFLKRHGLELIEAVMVDSHGGSLRGIAKKANGPWPVSASVAEAVAAETAMGLDKAETFHKFAADIETKKQKLNGVLRAFKAEGKKIAAFGAPAKATTLMYHFGIGPDLVDFIIDDSPLKQGLYSPGMHIPVLPGSAIVEKNPDILVVLAWNFAAPIIAKNQAFRDRGGRFVIPLPEVEVV